MLHQRSLQVELPLKYTQKQKGLCERGQGLTGWHWNTVCMLKRCGKVENCIPSTPKYLGRKPLPVVSGRDLSCCVEPIPIGSKEQTTLANHQSTIHCPTIPSPHKRPNSLSKETGPCLSKKTRGFNGEKERSSGGPLCAARTVDGGRSSEMTARLP